MERLTPLRPLPSPYGNTPQDVEGAGRRRRFRRRRWWFFRVPWTVYGYVSGEVLGVLLLAILAVSLLYTTLAAYQTVRSGIQIGFIWPLLLRTFAYPFYFSIPVSLLFATTLVIGRMSNDLEVTALRTHGISHVHIYTPVLGLGLVLAGVSFYLNGWIVPEIHYEKRNLQTYILDQLDSLGSGVNRTLLLPDDSGTLWVGAYRGTELRRVRVDLVPDKDSSALPVIREHLPDRLPARVTVLANEGTVRIQPDRKSAVLHLRSVQVLVPEAVRGATIANEIFHQTVTVTDNVFIPLSFSPKTPGTKDRSLPEMLDYAAQLRAEIRSGVPDGGAVPAVLSRELAATPTPAVLEGVGSAEPSRISTEELEKWRAGRRRKLAATMTEFHRRLAFTLSCLTFPLVGVSLSLLLSRWNRLVPFFVGNLLVIGLYYPLLTVGVALGEHGFVPALSLTLPNLALLGLGVVLARRVMLQ